MAKNDYQKINTLFLRDENNIIIPSKMACPEFEYLKDVKWEATEKIDGTNIHIDLVCEDMLEPTLKFCGRTANADIPPRLLKKLQSIFTIEKVTECFSEQMVDVLDGHIQIQIFGEGYGCKIQKGGNYIQNGVDFILFDVKVGDWWLKRENLIEIADKLEIKIVPFMGYMTIPEAIEFVKRGFKSTIAENKDYDAEGLVLKTPLGLQFRNGERIITKIKTCDFQKYKAKYGDHIVEQKLKPNYSKK